ncbi:hypothetical protein [Sphingomonas sp. HMP6]|uniref:hypothetical protein n=1 Tax=Sphingomonas sp. HMP6 TaxID=1517551 RepID=UPI0015970286|nr:hypothetical protein [Sphingomonas sp. HMP6]BCA58630.1 hypothetical protein HMP06_1399 [Sphingomonas sp. HMP6]
MSEQDKLIDDTALDGLSVAPGDPADAAADIHDPRQNAGQDESIAKRMERDPGSADAALDNGLDESMDASDPASSTQPGHTGAPAKSSGFDAEAEAAIQAERK